MTGWQELHDAEFKPSPELLIPENSERPCRPGKLPTKDKVQGGTN